MSYLPLADIHQYNDAMAKLIDLEIDEQNGLALTKKLNNISSLLGLSSNCCGSSEYWYQKDKKNPDAQAQRTYSDTVNKSAHYCIMALQTMIKALSNEKDGTRFQK